MKYSSLLNAFILTLTVGSMNKLYTKMKPSVIKLEQQKIINLHNRHRF